MGGVTAPWFGMEGRLDPAEKNDFLHRKDPNPNTLGIEAVLEAPITLEDLLAKIESGSITTLFILGADLSDEIVGKFTGLAQIVVIASSESPAAGVASLVLPGTIPFEKSGTFVNGEGRLQRFDKALELPDNALTEIGILSHLLSECATGDPCTDTAEAFGTMAGAVKAFNGLSFSTIPTGGTVVQIRGGA